MKTGGRSDDRQSWPSAPADQPLQGVVVLDLGQIYNAPYATLLMALAGATIIKVEPLAGENLRGRAHGSGVGVPFAMLNSNKLGVTLNLKSDAGLRVFRSMAQAADVVVENYRPGVMDRLGLSAESLRADNPRLIYASSSGYGRSGPYRDLAAMDLTMQAMAGVMSITGFAESPPVKAGPAVCDFFAGTHLYGAVVTALFARERTGVGCVVETSMFEAIYPSLTSSLGLLLSHADDVPARTGNRHGGLAEAPYNVYAAADGYISIICVTDEHWRALAALMDREDLAEHPDYATRARRVEHMEQVDAVVSRFTGERARDDLAALLVGARIPSAPVRELSEVVQDPHLHERGMLQEVEHPDLGQVTLHHSPLRYDSAQRVPLVPSPALGEHNRLVYRDWLGLSEPDFEELVDKGVI